MTRWWIDLALAALLAALVPTAAAAQSTVWSEDFQSWETQEDPTGWYDTNPGQPHEEAPGLFKTWPGPLDPANIVFGHKGASDAFSHYRSQTFGDGDLFRFEGRMLRGKDQTAIGVTVLSSFPTPEAYYIFAQEGKDSTVRLAASGAGPLAGVIDSGVSMTPEAWYRFAVQTLPGDGEVRIRAKIWLEGSPEPEDWQVDATDSTAPLAEGWVGLWGVGAGANYFDDLAVTRDDAPPVVTILESGLPFPDGFHFNRDVVPEVVVEDASPVTVEILLNGAPFVSGTPVVPEGIYELTVEAVDAYGNAASASVSFVVDKSPPVFTVVNPADGLITSATEVTLTGEVTDNFGVVTVTVDGGPATFDGLSFSAGPFPLDEGERVFTLEATDQAGNVAQITRRIVRDTIPPEVTIDQPSAPVLGAQPVTVSGSAVDLHLVSVTVNGLPAEISGSSYSVSGVPLAEGLNTLSAEATDAAGNVGTADREVVLDTIPPAISILDGGTALPDGLLVNRTVVPVVEVSDATETDVTITLNGAAFASGTPVSAEGTYQLAVTAVDQAGNSAAASVNFTIDLTPPSFVVIEPTAGTITATPEVTLSGTVSDNTGVVQVTVDGAPATLAGQDFTAGPFTLAEGERLFELTALDGAGNATTVGHPIVLDTIPPAISILESGGPFPDGEYFNRTVVPTYEVDDASPVTVEALLDGVAFVSGDPVSAEGSYTLTVEAVDAAGNASAASVSFTIDRTPPVFLAVEPPDGEVTASPEVTLSGQVDDNTGVAAVTVDGIPATLVGQDFSAGPFALAEGERIFLLEATDLAGNVAQRTHRAVLDTTPPAVTIDQPSAPVVGATPITVSGTAVDLHLEEVRLNGVPAVLTGASWSLSGVALTEGPNPLQAEAVDVVGNVGTAERTVILDTIPPAISILEGGAPLPDGLLVNRTVVPVVEVVDATEVDVTTTLDGAPFVSGTPVAAEGVYQLEVTAIDQAGNAASASVGFEIDLTPPEFLVVEPSDGTLTAAAEVTLSGQVSGDTVEVTVDGAPAALAGASFSAGPFPLAEGERIFQLGATDAAGNRTEQPHRIVRDSTPPELTIEQPADGAIFASSPIAVSGTVRDPHLLEVRVNGQPAAVAGESYSLAALALTEGENTVQVEAVDQVGNTSSSAVQVVLDTIPPTISILEGGAPLADGSLFNRPVTPILEVTDATEVTVEATLNGLPFTSGQAVRSDGLFQLDVVATDAAGNAATAGVGFEIDQTPPVFVSIEPADGSVQAEPEVTLTGVVEGAEEVTVDGQPATLAGESFTAGPFTLSGEERIFLLAATDRAGNRAERSHRILLDVTPPAVTIAAPADGALLGTAAVDVSGVADDPNLDTVTVNGIQAALTGTSFLARQVPLAEGANTLTALAADRAGNQGQAAVAVTLDTLPPTIAITDPAAGTRTAAALLPVSGSVSDPHLDRVEVNGLVAALAGSTWSAQVPLAEGGNDLVARAFDRLGASAEDSVTVVRDSTAPAVAIDTPTDGSFLNTPEIDVTGTVDDEPGVTVTVNGVAASVVAGSFVATGVPLVEGENRLVARARDDVGNEGVHTRTVILDTVPPAFVSSEPVVGALAVPVASDFVLTFSEELAPPAAGDVVLREAGGSDLAAAVEASAAVVTVTPAGDLPSGAALEIELGAALADRAGNPLADPRVLPYATADTAPPPAPVLDPVPSPLCAVDLDLDGSAEPAARIAVTGGAAAASGTADAAGAFTVRVELLPDRLNRLQATASDATGNASAPAVVEVVQDCRAPFVLRARRDGDLFTAELSEPVDPLTIDGAVTLTAASGPLAGDTSLSADGLEATLAPFDPVPEGTLRFAVSQQVRDPAGNALAYPFSRLFGGAGEPTFITGTVLDDATGRPLAGARVTVVATDGVALDEPLPEQTSGEDGRFSIPLPVGTHQVTVLRPGYSPVFRMATTVSGLGHDLFDPRLTPAAEAVAIGPAGGGLAGAGEVALTVPAGALAADTTASATALSEQGLPALLPYGWSPRGGAWVDLGGESLAALATLTLPVDAPDGTLLALAELDPATLQWRTVQVLPVDGGRITAAVAGEGAYAAVEADSGSLAPPPPVAGAVLGSSPPPAGGEVSGATLGFSPEVVLPAQTSLATALYTLGAEAPSGVPLTLVIQEELVLLDGTVRTGEPFRADLVLYRSPTGDARSRFRLRPSQAAQILPLSLGHEDVELHRYAGETVRGNVLGAGGGSVINDEGDRADLPPGAVDEPTAVILTRIDPAELPVAVPAAGTAVGALDLDAGGQLLAGPIDFLFAVSPAPDPAARGLLLEIVDRGDGPVLRAVAELVPVAEGWSTATIDPADLPWPGASGAGSYLFLELTADHGFFRGTVLDVGGVPLAGARISSPGVEWLQLSDAAGRYVFPAPVLPAPDEALLTAENPVTGNLGSGSGAPRTAGERVDLDLALAVVGPEVLEIVPADGATAVPAGIQPTIRFSEPVDPASAEAGITLTEGGTPVDVSLAVQGSLVTVLPAATLLPGAEFELAVGAAVRDLQGYPLAAPATSRFTTLRVLFNEDVDLTRVILVEPDATGFARVIGGAGAVPAFTLVFVENLTSLASTTSVEAEDDGSFLLTIEASLDDRLLLHVLIEGSNELILELTPFRTEDLKGAYVGAEASRFSTGDGIIVAVEEGTFDGPTLVRVEPEELTVETTPPPVGMSPVYAFSLDLGGADAKKGLMVSVPAPEGSEDTLYLLNRVVDTFHGDKWMMDDVALRVDGRLTSEEPEEEAPQTAWLYGTDPTERSAGRAVPAEFRHADLERLRAVYADRRPRLEGRIALAQTAPPPPEEEALPRHQMPGMFNPVKGKRNYVFMGSVHPLEFVSLPAVFGVGVAYFSPTIDIVAIVDSKVQALLEVPAIVIPSRLQQPFEIEVRDLATGYRLFEGVFDAPPAPGEPLELPLDEAFGDDEPPEPVAGSPIRFFPLEASRRQVRDLDPGIRVEVDETSGAITVTGDPGAAHPEVRVKLVPLGEGQTEFTTTDAEGAFSLTVDSALGERYLLVVSARLATFEALEIELNEALGTDLAGIDVTELGGASLAPTIEGVGTFERVRISPVSGWQAGETYLLKLGPEMADASENAWGIDLEIRFEIERTRVLDTYDLGEARDVARVGSLLFVAGGAQGLVILDASNPGNLVNFIPGDVTFPFILSASVRGVAADPHGRVLVAGGGDRTPGQILILDPLALDPEAIGATPEDIDVRYAAFKGNTIVSNYPGGFYNLPAGTPRRMAVLSNDQVDEWRLGEGAPAGISVSGSPPADGSDYQITVSGTGASPGLPVTLTDVELGRWNRVDAGDNGSFSIPLTVTPGTKLRLLRNQETVAFVAVSNAGVASVDINAFYNEPEDNPIKIDVLGFYTGQGAGLTFCGEPTDQLGMVLNLGVMFEEDNPNPLTIPTLIYQAGMLMLEAPAGSPASMQALTTECTVVNGTRQVVGLEVLQDFPFDLDRDGEFDEFERDKDYLVVGHATGGVLLYDVTVRGAPVRVAHIRLPGYVNHLALDRKERRLLAAGYGGGLNVIDLNGPLTTAFVDVNEDGRDDRIVENVELDGTTRSPILLVPELGLAYVGGANRGLTGMSIDGPSIQALGRVPDGGFREIDRLAPFGVPTGPDGEPDADGTPPPDRVGAFHILASLPGVTESTIRLDVVSLGPGGLAIPEAGDPDAIAGLPRASLSGDNGVELRRLSDVPTDPAYQLFLSEEIRVVADLRAARDYQRTTREDDDCTRCAADLEDVSQSAVELLSGERVKIRLPAVIRAVLEATYEASRIDAAEIELASVRWDSSPAVRQEPTLNPSLGYGEVAPSTLLHSGEYSRPVTDLFIKGRGFDFAFTRTYRSQTVGAGPLGPGWDHGYRQRLRELPDKDVELYDGRGRRELFTWNEDEQKFVAPTGRFEELKRVAFGWLLIDARRNQARFDRFGRLKSLADHVKDSADTGNEMTFHYDPASNLVRVTDTLDRDVFFEYDDAGRLVSITDFDEREVRYEYDEFGRLTSVRSPRIAGGELPYPDGLTTTRVYETPAAGSLAANLNSRDNMTSSTDARGTTWLELTYTDADNDGRPDEVTSQTWGGDGLSIDYDFAARKATVTDRRGNTSFCIHDEDGHALTHRDQGTHEWTFEYDEEGLVTLERLPLGRVTRTTYDTSGRRRSRGNAVEIRVEPDGRGANGSSAVLETTIEYESGTNQPTEIRDPRGALTKITRTPTGLAKTVTRAHGAVEASTVETKFNAFGQPIEITNPNGHVTELQYFDSGDSEGYLQERVVDRDGLRLTTRYTTDRRGNVTSITDPRGVRHEAVWNEVDWQVETTAAATPSDDGALRLDYRSFFLYDQNGNLTGERLPFGPTGDEHTANTYTYDELDRLTSTTREIESGGAAVVEIRTYDANRNLDTLTEPEGNVTKYTYDARNLVETVTRGFGSGDDVIDRFVFDADRQQTLFTNGRGHAWKSEYDGYGRVARSTDPTNDYSTASYDDNGNPIGSKSFDATDRILSEGTAEYDLLNRRFKTHRVLWEGDRGTTTETFTLESTYDAASNLVSTKDFLNRVTSYEYDDAERLVATNDAAGNRMEYTLDANGNVLHRDSIEVIPGDGSVTVPMDYVYDALDRRIEARDALNNRTRRVWDARSKVQRTIDAEDFFTQYTYDGLDRLISSTRPESIREEYVYDRNSRLTTYRDALGNETIYGYDALNRKTVTRYEDDTSETYAYDDADNIESIQDANGSIVTQIHDPDNRLTSRAITSGPGVEGPTAESYTYDGLDRLVRADSGGVVTDLAYDSFSRRISETSMGRTVDYGYDAEGNATRLGYPSGLSVDQDFDPLDRPLSVGSDAVQYRYRGPDLVQSRTYANGLTGSHTFDPAKRLTENRTERPDGTPALHERMSWSPRGLKTASERVDLGGQGLLLNYDGAGRVTQAAKLPTPTDLAPNNLPPSVPTFDDGFEFDYDAAENLLGKTRKVGGLELEQLTPPDVSGRNRPGEINGIPLSWDANGNLASKGDNLYFYDYRDRLTRVERRLEDGSTELVARYTYDAFNRRIRKEADGETRETVWAGWREIEDYALDPEEGPLLSTRRTYGLGLDEIVELEADLDGDGVPDIASIPLYDSTGNLVAATNAGGQAIERYDFSPYGERTIRVDLQGPQVEQVRVADQSIVVELSEAAQPSALERAVDDGSLSLEDAGGAISSSLSIPVTTGRQARRRFVLDPSALPVAGETLTLTIPGPALVDDFQNAALADFVLTFDWPTSDAVIVDGTAPRLVSVAIDDGALVIQLSEPPDPAAAASTVTLDGQPTSWTVDTAGYTLLLADAIPGGEHDLAIGTGPLDLAGNGLAAPFVTTFSVTETAGGGGGEVSASQGDRFLFEADDPDEVAISTVGNIFGFHGRPVDSETGFVYVRNRYFDPELGRFLSIDPLGFVDGPSTYQYGTNNPLNYADQLGLCVGPLRKTAPCQWVSDQLTYFIAGDPIARANQESAERAFYFQKRREFRALHGRNPEANEQIFRNSQIVLSGSGEVTDITGRIEAAHTEYAVAAILIPGGQAALAARAGGATLRHQVTTATASVADDLAGEIIGFNPRTVASIRSQLPKKGVYEFPDARAPGKRYVGQTGDMPRRLGEHERVGRLVDAGDVKAREVPGGKTAREVVEQRRLNELGGPERMPGSRASNKVNPIGERRRAQVEAEYGPIDPPKPPDG